MFPNRMAGLLIGLLCLVRGEAMALSLDEALTRAALAPDVLSSRADEEAAQALASAAGQLPDPRLVLTVDDFMLEGESRYRFDGSKRMLGVMQELPAATKREAERQKAEAVREGSARAREFAQLAARREVSLLWLKLHFLTRKEALLKVSADEIQRRHKVSVATLAGGGGADMALEPLFDRQEVDDAFDLLTRDLQVVRAGLARWIGPLVPNETASGELPAWAREAVVSSADAARAPGDADPETELRASKARIGVAEAEWLMARADKSLDWSVEIGFGRDAMGQSMMMAKVGLSLPVFPDSRQTPRITAARAMLVSAEAEHAMRKAEFTRQREELLADETALCARLDRLAVETLPLLDRAISLAEAAFSSGKGSAVALIMAREKRLAAQMRVIDLEAERAAVRTRLHFLQQRGGETS